MLQLDDTIVAIASPSGGAAEGIVRLSGPAVSACLASGFHPRQPWATAGSYPSNICGKFLVEGLSSPIPCRIYWWPDRRSYTGQPSAELHTLGSAPLLDAIVRSLCHAGARLAEPGEFTLRAFLSGRVDLTQAEAVLGVIDAISPTALRTALHQLAGGLAEPLRKSRGQLLDLLADLEAGLDFTEEDIRFLAPDEMLTRLKETRRLIEDLASQLATRSEIGPLVRVVLVGRPNVGKSSLFNRLAGRCGAIVSALPGTTRDYLAAELELEQVCCLLIDTAGVLERPQHDLTIDVQAEMASRQQSNAAQLRILCLDSTRPIDAWEAVELNRESANDTIVVLTKADAAPTTPISSLGGYPNLRRAIAVSSHTGGGIELLRSAIRQKTAETGGLTDCVPTTALRCRESVRLAIEAIARAETLVGDDSGEELVAAEVRLALQELGRVVGAVYTDDVLDRVFSRFCIGK